MTGNPRQGRTAPLMSGILGGGQLVSTMQVFNQLSYSGTLVILGPDRAGSIYYRRGQVIHADDHISQGVEAFYNLVGLEDGQYQFWAGESEVPQTIRRSHQNLLMDAMASIDDPLALVRNNASSVIEEVFRTDDHEQQQQAEQQGEHISLGPDDLELDDGAENPAPGAPAQVTPAGASQPITPRPAPQAAPTITADATALEDHAPLADQRPAPSPAQAAFLDRSAVNQAGQGIHIPPPAAALYQPSEEMIAHLQEVMIAVIGPAGRVIPGAAARKLGEVPASEGDRLLMKAIIERIPQHLRDNFETQWRARGYTI